MTSSIHTGSLDGDDAMMRTMMIDYDDDSQSSSLSLLQRLRITV